MCTQEKRTQGSHNLCRCVDLMPWVRDGGVYTQQKGWGRGGQGLQLTCRMGISLSSAWHSSSRRALGHGQCSTRAVLQAQVSAEPSTRSQPPASPGASSRPSYLGPPLPLLPSCCSSTALQPCQSLPGQGVSSLLACLPVPTLRSSSLLYTIGLDLWVLLPPFSPA